MQEVWKDIQGFEEVYAVSNYGRVKSYERDIKHSCGKVQKVPERIKKPQIVRKGKGYEAVALYKNSKQKQEYVHRLVASAFIPNPENKPQINHKDGDTRNNHVSNLEWVTSKENLKHARDAGYLSDNHPVKVTFKDGSEKVYYSVTESAKETGVSHATVLNVLKGVTKKPRNGLIYQYVEKV